MRTALLVLALAATAAASIAHIPTDSPVYDDVELLRVAGFVRTAPPTSRPWTRSQAGRLAFEAESLAAGRRLAPGLRAALARLAREFREYLAPGGGYGGPRRPVLSLPVPPAGPDARFDADLFSRGGVRRLGGRTDVFGSLGATLGNRPGADFAFLERAEFTVFRPDTVEVADSAGHYVRGTRVESWMNLGTLEVEQAWLAFRLPWRLRLGVGRDEFRWGPGYTGAVILGDEAPALDHVGLVADYGGFKYQGLTAYLSRWGLKHRFVSLQRVELSPWRRLRLGGVLANVYSWDSLQTRSFFGMMNPLIPIYLEVANSGHDDNLLVGADLVLDFAPFRAYAALLVDNFEFLPREQMPPNATAVQVGGRWAPNLPLDVRAEYVRINPFTYYHRIHHIMYEHYGMPLGHGLGPDADLLDLRVGLFPAEPLELCAFGRHVRRGYHNRGDFERRSWLGGGLPGGFPSELEGELIERELRLGLEAGLRPLRDLRVLGDFSWWRRENADGTTERRSGLDFGLRFEYRY
ncbi:MAG: capsule assembly Wzi family protein [bacterium]